MRLIDLSHTIEPDMPRFSPNVPAPRISGWQTHAESETSGHYVDCTCEISHVEFVTSIGTYLDSPYHFHPEGKTIAALHLDQLVLPGILIDCTHVQARTAIDPESVTGINVEGKAVLFHTGWNRYWGHPTYFDFPFLTAETAEVLTAGGAKLAGVDFLVIDDTANPRRPVHVKLLQNEILIVENLTNLDALPSSGFTFHAIPPKISGAAAFPVRAFAMI